MRDRATRILLIVAPSRPDCIRTAEAYDIDVEVNSNQVRLISTLRALLGWNEGTAFVSLGRMFWPMSGRHPLYLALSSLERSGHFRAAGEPDLAPLRSTFPVGQVCNPINPHWRMSQDVQG